ncbi:MAG: type II toxin-antitoxin system VapC family toxin, partial [Conexivisphaera sp.]
MDVFKLASEEGLTVYDASYLLLAMRKRSILVTDDAELRDKASKYVKVTSSSQVAGNSGEDPVRCSREPGGLRARPGYEVPVYLQDPYPPPPRLLQRLLR